MFVVPLIYSAEYRQIDSYEEASYVIKQTLESNCKYIQSIRTTGHLLDGSIPGLPAFRRRMLGILMALAPRWRLTGRHVFYALNTETQ